MIKVYCGKDAAMVESDDFSISFLRIRDDNIISILEHASFGIIGYVAGYGKNFDAHADYCFINPESGTKHYTSLEVCDELEKHKGDSVRANGEKELIYTTYNGLSFGLQSAETSQSEYISFTEDEIQNMSLSDKMKHWNCNKLLEFQDFESGFFVDGKINTEKYSIVFNIDSIEKFVYCRFGVHGYCDKGYSMLSTVCIRHNECRMIDDNTEALKSYIPNEEYFVDDSCAFPDDGSWYWSVGKYDNNTIYLNGCGGQVYEIHRR